MIERILCAWRGASRGRGGFRALVLVFAVAGPVGTMAAAGASEPSDAVIEEPDPDSGVARVRADIARLELAGIVDDPSLLAARELLAAADAHAARADELVAAASSADATVRALEAEIRSARRSVEAPATADRASQVALTDARDRLDAALERGRADLAALDRRGPAILGRLGDERAAEAERSAMPGGDAESSAVRGAEREGTAGRALEDARRLERSGATRALRRELGTIAPRARVAATRLRLLELRRRALDRRLDASVRSDDDARLAAADARTRELERRLELGEGAPEADRERWTLALDHARALGELAGEASALRAGDDRLERDRAALLDAEAGVAAVLASGNLGDAEGALLGRLRREMPLPRTLAGFLEVTERDIDRLRLRRSQWQEELRVRDRTEGDSSRAPGEGSSGATGEDPDDVEALRALIDAARRRGERLQARALALGDDVERADALAALLDRRLLWLRRSEPFGAGLLSDLAAGARWLGDPAELAGVRDAFLGTLRTAPGRVALPVLFALGWLALRRRLLALESGLAERVGNVARDAWWVTPAAIALVIPLALPLPFGLAAAGWPLVDIGVVGTLAHALGVALLAAASLVFALGLFRWLSRSEGVFATHFGWDEVAARDLHRYLGRFMRVQVPMSFLLAAALASARPELRYGLGLLAFTAASLALGGLAWRLFRPATGVLALVAARPRPSVSARAAGLLCIAVPAGIGLLPLAGWLDAAIALQAQVFRSVLLLLAGAVLYGLLMRLYAVSLRRYALRWARAQRAGRARSRDAAATGDALPGAVVSESLAPAPLAGQARVALIALVVVCVAVGLWWLWAPLLPALGVADEIVLWRRTGVAGDPSTVTDVTLWSLILAASLATGGILAARNLRGLLQVGLLRRLDLDPGTRYAMVTIAGYVALGAGLVGALAQLGIDWSKLQWIVAALGVGLGFGLQEIVANFVSGLIILFERPVRVGDTVTIGTLSGTVSDIRIRATTVTDFENREVLLPNKSIITENVTNWTLHDSITRLLLSIGVAYGSDVQAVRALLTGIVRSHPDVLATPASTVFFVGHGPSSLDFELRVFVASPSQRLPVTHDLNAAIGARLAEAGIGIPFPQTDVHLHVVGESRSDAALNMLPTARETPHRPHSWGNDAASGAHRP